MAAAYDGDGNRVFQLNFNPEKDEDFTEYYKTYSNKSYTGSGILFPVCEEVSDAEQDLMDKIYPGQDGKYELTEYLNDVNREYAQVLVEQNLNGKTDHVYTYGVDRLSQEKWNCAGRTSYYLYDSRGSVTGLTSQKGQLCRTYQYSPYGEITFGASSYENEYTYNGESYNPNIHSQYLRARYYNVVTADFLTQDSYLGTILEPLTLNRYSYCVGNPVNFRDPSGHGNESFNPPSPDFEEYKSPEEQMEEWEESRLSWKQGYNDVTVELFGEATKYIYASVKGFENLIGIGDMTASEALTWAEYSLDNYIDERAKAASDISSYYSGRCEGQKDWILAGITILLSGMSEAAGSAPSNGVVPIPNGDGTVSLGITGSGAIVKGNVAEGLLGSIIINKGIWSFKDSGGKKKGEGDSDAPKKESVGRQKGNAPRNNQAQNRQIRDIEKKLGLTKDEVRELHDAITGQGYSYQEILDLAKDMFGK